MLQIHKFSLVLVVWTKEPIQSWIYMDVTQSPFFEFVFLLSCLAQMYVGLAMGQFGKSIYVM